MKKYNITFQKRESISLAIAAALFLLSICLSFILLLQNSLKQRESMDATKRYMAFESKVERLVYSNIALLQGFEAYIKANPDLDEDGAYRYLKYLLSDDLTYIRNIGVIQDTTILWNYPKDANAEAIGVDLSKVDAQRNLVLKVKAELKPVFQGPIDLVQGGPGFSARLPIVRGGADYWG